MTCGIHQDDIGTQIRIQISDCNDIAIDISTSNLKQIIFKKPNGTLLTKTADFLTDGTDGIIYCIISSGDLDIVGTWKVQAIISFGAYTFHSDFESFRVYRNIS